jgi:hypothetical protein
MSEVPLRFSGLAALCGHAMVQGDHKTGSLRKRKDEARSRNHCCRGKALIIKHYAYVFSSLSYPACKAHAPYYIVICGLSGSTIFFHIIS